MANNESKEIQSAGHSGVAGFIMLDDILFNVNDFRCIAPSNGKLESKTVIYFQSGGAPAYIKESPTEVRRKMILAQEEHYRQMARAFALYGEFHKVLNALGVKVKE